MSSTASPQSTNNGLAAPVTGAGTGDVALVNEQVNVQPQPVTDVNSAKTAIGSTNIIDTYLYDNFFYLTSFSWSTADTQAKVLYSVPIAPEYSFDQVRYLSRMYNTWVGGFDFEMEIAGTGFNGGRLIAAVLPPNMSDPSKYTIQLLNTFNNITMDVKMGDGKVMEVGDQRSTTFHWNQKFTSTFGQINNVGGFFVVMVQLKLISGNANTSSVDVLLRQRLAPDFSFDQMIPPSDSMTSDSDADLWNQFGQIASRDAFRAIPLKQLFVGTTTQQDLCASTRGDDDTIAATTSKTAFSVLFDPTAPDHNWSAKIQSSPSIDMHYAYGGKVGVSRIADGIGATISECTSFISMEDNTITFNTPDAEYAFESGITGLITYLEGSKLYTPNVSVDSAADIIAPNDERIITFVTEMGGASTQYPGAYLTTHQQLMHTNGLPKPSTVFNPIFLAYDTTSNLPLFHVRYSSGGFFSTNLSGPLVLPLGTLELRYLQVLQENERLPQTPMYGNIALALSLNIYT
nr:TPA_asm: hypothetical protein [Vittapili virus]